MVDIFLMCGQYQWYLDKPAKDLNMHLASLEGWTDLEYMPGADYLVGRHTTLVGSRGQGVVPRPATYTPHCIELMFTHKLFPVFESTSVLIPDPRGENLYLASIPDTGPQNFSEEKMRRLITSATIQYLADNLRGNGCYPLTRNKLPCSA